MTTVDEFDWNGRFQTALEMSEDSPDTARLKFEQLTKLWAASLFFLPICRHACVLSAASWMDV